MYNHITQEVCGCEVVVMGLVWLNVGFFERQTAEIAQFRRSNTNITQCGGPRSITNR
eukprot:TRINITY_DN12975_c0_g1_i1.p2 TRINITY_DN12975_c0_g1~~TRINITY_DN12975_c0_g1_i1.p2  ORF type:complete len:57 (-),score=6.12 TRINITY_DN12975_c0_g1_i1:85-255(-)